MKKLVLFTFLVVLFSTSLTINAQVTYSWRNEQGSASSGLWNNSNNWWRGYAELPGGAEILYLDGNVGLSMTNDLPSTNRYRIIFGAGGASRTVNGTAENDFYDFGGNKPKIENNSSNNQTISFPFNFGYSGGMELNPVDGNLTISGAVNRQARTLYVYTKSSSPKTLFINSTFSGSGDVYLYDGSTMSFGNGGTISGSGVYYIENGTLTFTTGGAFGSGTDVRISSSGQLNLNNISISVRSVAERETSNGGTISLGSGTLTIAGGWGTGNVLYQNSISGTGSIVKQGTGTLALYGTQSFTGGINIESEVLSSSSNLSSSLITVSSGATFSVTDNISVNSLTINSEAFLNIAAGKTLTINGTLTIKGSYTISGGGTLVYGTNGILKYEGSAITITADDVFPASSGPKDLQIADVNAGGISLHANRTIAGALTINAEEKFIIPATKSLTVTGTLTNSASASGLVIESGGSLITNGTVSGSATVKREIAEDFKWHFLSSPVSGQIICDGNFAPTSDNFNSGTGATYDFYKWSEPVVSGDLNWINLKKSDWSLNTAEFGLTPQFEVTKGYLVAYSSSFAGEPIKSFAGALTSGDQTVALTAGGNQWNLIGNPFASAINWDGVSKTSLVDGYYSVYNENKDGGAGYEYYLDATHKTDGANGKISATQGFFVKVKSTETSILLPNAARVHDNNWMKNTEVTPLDQLVLKLSHGSNFDEAFIQFETQGTTGKDFFDAEKMFSFSSEIPQVYTTIENEIKIAFNSMPLNSELFSIPLGVYIPADGDYVLDISNIEGLTTSAGVVLEDLKINVLQDLNTDPTYQFTAAVNDDPDRFLLHFGTVGISTPTQENLAVIYSHGGVIFLTGAPANAEIKVSNLTGQIMLQGKSAGNSLTSLNATTLAKGIYVVSVLSNGQLTSRKVVL